MATVMRSVTASESDARRVTVMALLAAAMLLVLLAGALAALPPWERQQAVQGSFHASTVADYGQRLDTVVARQRPAGN